MEHATLSTLDDADERRPKRLTRYSDDVHAWALEQAELLQTGRFDDLDLTNLADEVADVAQREYDKMESDLARVIQHLLKWELQPDRRGASWANTIREHRRRVDRQLRRFPSLKSRQLEALEDAFARGRGDALIETALPDSALSDINPFTWDEAMTRPAIWRGP